MADVFCNQCGHRNPGNSNFCSSCGAALDVRGEDHTITLAPAEELADPTDEVSIALDDLPDGAGMLVVKRGPGAGSRFLLDQEVVTAGRHPDSDIFLDDVTVSRRHAEVARSSDGYVVRDTGSLNGTYLNRERIEREMPLKNGDELQVGRFKLVFLDVGRIVTEPVAERAFLSIGEVLELLKAEFPDITISKIRFLESQGLLDPERTPSGYRKFHEPDVARLRWILEQQREHFLPLKVIKERILAQSRDAAPTEAAEAHPAGPAPEEPAAEAPPVEQDPIRPRPQPSTLVAGLSSVSLTITELASSTGLDIAAIQELKRYGLLASRSVGGQVYYDEEALVVARLAAGFARHGVEARHLRMYKTAAEREAGFYEQVIMPLVKQRNPTARRQALDTLDDLSRLGEGMRAAFLRAALRDHTEG